MAIMIVTYLRGLLQGLNALNTGKALKTASIRNAKCPVLFLSGWNVGIPDFRHTGLILYGPLILLSLLNSASLSSIMRCVQGHIPGVRQSQAWDEVSWLLAIQGTVRGSGTRQMRKC